MANGSVKIFQRSGTFKALTILFALVFMLLLGCFLLTIDIHLWIAVGYVFLILVVVFGLVIMASDKIMVSSDSIISGNLFKSRSIAFKDIKRIYVKKVERVYLLMVTTSESHIKLQGGATKKQLDEMVAYILEQIRVNDPECYLLVNLPSYEVEDFWRK